MTAEVTKANTYVVQTNDDVVNVQKANTYYVFTQTGSLEVTKANSYYVMSELGKLDPLVPRLDLSQDMRIAPLKETLQ